jgi:hypothetical protein
LRKVGLGKEALGVGKRPNIEAFGFETDLEGFQDGRVVIDDDQDRGGVGDRSLLPAARTGRLL